MQQDGHFLSVCRYVERNALRAKCVHKSENWRWSSLCVRENAAGPMEGMLADWPVRMPRNWLARVNRSEDEKELLALRTSGERGRPYGEADWTVATAARLGIDSSLRPVGRPRKRVEAVNGKRGL